MEKSPPRFPSKFYRCDRCKKLVKSVWIVRMGDINFIKAKPWEHKLCGPCAGRISDELIEQFDRDCDERY
jgi:hypothetical protein